MKITIESTTKMIQINGVDARIWEGETESGIKVHCYVTRIAIDEDEPNEVKEQFRTELKECKRPSPAIEGYDARLIL